VTEELCPKFKQPRMKTLEEEKQELEDSMISSRHQEYVRKEMDKIREEWKPWIENSVTDTHKVIYEAERRVKKDG
jgi:flavorubredoxin